MELPRRKRAVRVETVDHDILIDGEDTRGIGHPKDASAWGAWDRQAAADMQALPVQIERSCQEQISLDRRVPGETSAARHGDVAVRQAPRHVLVRTDESGRNWAENARGLQHS